MKAVLRNSAPVANTIPPRAAFAPWAALAIVLLAAAALRWRLLDVPLERDEGEFAYMAQQWLRGVPPYVSGYAMKMPGIYAVYALIFAVFGETSRGIHLGLLVANQMALV